MFKPVSRSLSPRPSYSQDSEIIVSSIVNINLNFSVYIKYLEKFKNIKIEDILLELRVLFRNFGSILNWKTNKSVKNPYHDIKFTYTTIDGIINKENGNVHDVAKKYISYFNNFFKKYKFISNIYLNIDCIGDGFEDRLNINFHGNATQFENCKIKMIVQTTSIPIKDYF